MRIKNRILVVGSGFAGSTISNILAENGYEIDLIDKRDHVGGNAYDYEDPSGIRIHKYGPHIFHTNNYRVVNFLSRFTNWIPYKHKVKALLENGEFIKFPPNKETFEKILPKDLKHFYPNLTYFNDWDRDRPVGIGTVIQEWKVKDEKTGEDIYMLSKNVIGHGSATSSQFRIDLDNNIIITQTRRRGKSRFGNHFETMYQHIDNHLVKGVK